MANDLNVAIFGARGFAGRLVARRPAGPRKRRSAAARVRFDDPCAPAKGRVLKLKGMSSGSAQANASRGNVAWTIKPRGEAGASASAPP